MAKTKHGTLVANAVTTVTFTADFGKVEVLNRGSADLWFRIDGTDPVIGEDDVEICPAGQWAIVDRSDLNGATEVRLISAAAVPYSVRGF